MNYSKVESWVSRKVNIKKRLIVVVTYIIFLMTPMRKHSLDAAARFSNSSKSRFSKFLKNHSDLAVTTLGNLSKRQAKQFTKIMKFLENNSLPWKVAIIVDSTIQKRSSLHPKNSQRFNHGKGFVIGHQWTNIVLIINDVLIPLPPIPFYTTRYCRENNIKYKTEHEYLIEYIKNLNLKDYIGSHNPKEVVVLADSGYDDKDIEKTIARKKWIFIIALKKNRGVKTKKQYLNTPKSKDWHQVGVLYNKHRRVKWVTIRVPKKNSKKKRMEFRIRQIIGYLRNVGEVQLICSEFKKSPKGRRKYLACNDLNVKARHIIMAYRLRWAIEIFHKAVKMFLGFEDVATISFKSVISHVHWVYCAYILLNLKLPGIPEEIQSIAEKCRVIKKIAERKELSRINQLLAQINGVQRYKNEIRKALEVPLSLKTLNL